MLYTIFDKILRGLLVMNLLIFYIIFYINTLRFFKKNKKIIKVGGRTNKLFLALVAKIIRFFDIFKKQTNSGFYLNKTVCVVTPLQYNGYQILQTFFILPIIIITVSFFVKFYKNKGEPFKTVFLIFIIHHFELLDKVGELHWAELIKYLLRNPEYIYKNTPLLILVTWVVFMIFLVVLFIIIFIIFSIVCFGKSIFSTEFVSSGALWDFFFSMFVILFLTYFNFYFYVMFPDSENRSDSMDFLGFTVFLMLIFLFSLLYWIYIYISYLLMYLFL